MKKEKSSKRTRESALRLLSLHGNLNLAETRRLLAVEGGNKEIWDAWGLIMAEKIPGWVPIKHKR
jgi:hypothetical protein